MPTVIDALVVTLGLDSKQWTQGREQAEKETETTRRKTKEAAEDISKSLQDVGKTIAGLFLGFESATGFAKWLGSLNAGEAALGRTAKNLGINVHELNRWGNATQLAGGEATDAQAAFTQLTTEAEKFFVTGEASPLINTLQQYGVSLKDSKGQLRNQGEIFEELADKTAVYGAQYQNFVLKQAGITQGEINYLVKSKQERAELLRIAEKNNGVTEESVRKAQELQQYWRDVGQQISQAGQAILQEITPYIETAMHKTGELYQQIRNSDAAKTGVKAITAEFSNLTALVNTVISGWKQLFDLPTPPWLKAIERVASGLVNFVPNLVFKNKFGWDNGEHPDETAAPPTSDNSAQPAAGGYVPPTGTKAARYNNPGNILDRQGNEIKYATLAEGQAALEKDLAIKMRRGLKTVDSIIDAYEGGDTARNNIPAYQADVKRRLGKNDLSEADIKDLSYAIGTHESGVSAGPTPGLVASGKGGSTVGDTSISVGTIQVNSPNADPVKVAEEVPAALQRKMSVSMADSGQS